MPFLTSPPAGELMQLMLRGWGEQLKLNLILTDYYAIRPTYNIATCLR